MILLDMDVLIDVALDRTPHAGPAGELLRHLETAPRMAFVAWHSLANFYYLVRPARGDSDARGFLTELTRFVLVAPTDTEAFQYAAALPMKDFEDAMQVAAARSCGADVIVTHNLKDYQHAPLSALTPKQVLASLL